MMWHRKIVKLEKKSKDEELSKGWLFNFWAEWKVHKRYDSEFRAIQTHDQLVKSDFYRRFDWRIVSPMGTIRLP
jgi:hypothetical protein